MRAKNFNMIEILLALFVISIGVSGIMGLLPVGFRMAGNARAENYASFAVDQFTSWIQMQSQSDWSFVTAAETQNKTSYTETFSGLPTSGNLDNGIGNIYSSGTSGVYRYVQKSQINGADILDFNAVIAIWQKTADTSSVKMYVPKNSVVQTIDCSSVVRMFYLEISWPAHKAYAYREKRTFNFCVRKTN